MDSYHEKIRRNLIFSSAITLAILFLNVPIEGIIVSFVKLGAVKEQAGLPFDSKMKIILLIIILYHLIHYFQLYITNFRKIVIYKSQSYYLESYLKIVKNEKSLKKFSIGKLSNFDVAKLKDRKKEYGSFWRLETDRAESVFEVSKNYNKLEFNERKVRVFPSDTKEDSTCREYYVSALVKNSKGSIQNQDYRKIQTARIYLSVDLKMYCKLRSIYCLMFKDTILIDYALPFAIGFLAIIMILKQGL